MDTRYRNKYFVVEGGEGRLRDVVYCDGVGVVVKNSILFYYTNLLARFLSYFMLSYFTNVRRLRKGKLLPTQYYKILILIPAPSNGQVVRT